ncbi:histidine phosphatase family protein [Pseudogracilibacillus sp. SO30301A]|uniref:histidine phosphatase family protein n=1 Tax=Pseudogracilibacillus sp. SO30301A TaxID=3098291 RepID=UPI00300DFBE1
MTTICIIRHGETDWNREGRMQGIADIPMNPTGKEQAEKCATFLAQSNWDVIISSPLTRAKETSLIINKKLQLPIIEMAAFKERDYGDAEGMTREEREAMFPDREFPNQESRESLTTRVMGGIQKLHDTYPGGKVLLVAHGGVINAILATISNGDIGSGKTSLSHACISNIYYDQDKWMIKNYNQITHL